jgi:hypothetical protein
MAIIDGPSRCQERLEAGVGSILMYCKDSYNLLRSPQLRQMLGLSTLLGWACGLGYVVC